jgi:hypothetical protein
VTADVLFVSVPAVYDGVRLEGLSVAVFRDPVSLPERIAKQFDNSVLLVQVAQSRLVCLGVDGGTLGVTLADHVKVVNGGQYANAIGLDVLDASVDVRFSICIFVLQKNPMNFSNLKSRFYFLNKPFENS